MDFRKEWFKNKILNYFEENQPDLFDIFLKKNDELVLNYINSFLDDETDGVVDINKQVFIVFKTYYSKIVLEEVEVQEEVTKQRSSFLPQDDKKKDKRGKKKKKGKKSKDTKEDEDEEGEEFTKQEGETSSNLENIKFDDIDEDDKQRIRKTKKSGKSGGRISPYTMVENLPLEEQTIKSKATLSFVTVKKKVEKVVQVPQFQSYFGIFADEKFESSNYYVYFVKKMNCKIPQFSTLEEANFKMPFYVTFGSMTGSIFQNLEKILNLVFIPLFRCQCSLLDKNVNSVESNTIHLQKRPSYFYLQNCNDSFNVMKDELSIKSSNSLLYDQLQNFMKPEAEREWRELQNLLMKLIDIVKWAQTQLNIENLFEIPDQLHEFDWDNLDVTEVIVEHSQNIVQAYIAKIDSQCSNLLHYVSSDENLLNEYEHWKQMEIYLSTVIDEMNSPISNKIVGVVKIHHPSLFDNFETKYAAFYHEYVCVKENADLLQTLQYFFKILINGDFKSISNCIPTLMDSLQSIWILSEYYCKEQNLERILINIKNTFCRRTKEAFNVTLLFKNSWIFMKNNIDNTILMLQTWKKSYLEVRARIESTRDYFVHRWEFDKQKLFSETDYIGSVIEDIRDVFEVVESYRCLFNSKFRKMIEQTSEFKNLEQKVSNLTILIEKVDFDIYLEIFKDEWNEILETFQQDVVEVDQRLKILIIKTFSQIKSVKEGIDVVQNLSTIQTRPTVHESVYYICNKIIAQFIQEIKLTDRLFEKNKLIHATVKIYDTINWANSLSENLRKTTDLLQTVDSLSELENFKEVLKMMENFTMSVKNYTNKMFEEWCYLTTPLIKNILNENVIEIEEAGKFVDLKKIQKIVKSDENNLKNEHFGISCGDQKVRSDNKDVGFGALSMTLKWIAKSKIMSENALKKRKLETLKQIEEAHKTSWLEFVANSLLIEKGFKFKIKFQEDIFEIIEESKNLRENGFNLPNEITELFVIKNDLKQYVKSINEALKKYNNIIDNLQPAKILLMKKYLFETEMTLQAGLGLYTWKCTILKTYIRKISSTLQKLDCLLYQTNQIFKKLDDEIESIENLNLLPIKSITTTDMKCEEFFQEVDSLQRKEANKCLKTYNLISMTLIQIESLILFTNMGRSEIMTYYYTCYSEKIVSVLTASILNSISELNSLVRGELTVFFRMKTSLENNDIKLKPNCAELFHAMKIAITRTFYRLRCLKQWELGSCLVGKYSAEMFYVRVILNPEIKARCELLLQNVQKLCDALKLSIARWLMYSILWKYNKKTVIKHFARENPKLADYEMRFDFYQNVVDKIEQEKHLINVFCVNMETNELIQQLKNHCSQWKCNLGIQLTLHTRSCVEQILKTILNFNSILLQEIKSTSTLTEVLQTINEIQETAFEMEFKLYTIEEHHHELIMQNFTVSETDELNFHKVKLAWEDLYNESLYKKFSLEVIKKSTTNAIKLKINKFIDACKSFVDEYTKEKHNFKPNEFDLSIDFIVRYFQKCEELYEEYKKLKIEQSCFEIAPFDFEFFIRIKNELEILREEFKLDE